MTKPIDPEMLSTTLADTYVNMRIRALSQKDDGTVNFDAPVLTGLNRKDRQTAETILTTLGIKGYWSRVEKGIVLEPGIKHTGKPRTDAAEYIASSLRSAGFSATIIHSTI